LTAYLAGIYTSMPNGLGTFNPPPGLSQSDIPMRYTYPGNEQPLNGANYTSAAANIGGDVVQTPIFWDVN